MVSSMIKSKAGDAMFPSHESHRHSQRPRLLAPSFSAAGEGVGVWRPLASHPLDVILQHNLAKRAVQALYKVHGIEYIYGSISTTLCE